MLQSEHHRAHKEKVMNTIFNELKKLSPHGASERQVFMHHRLPKGKDDAFLRQKIIYEDDKRFINYALRDYLTRNTARVDVHRRTPIRIDEDRRTSTLSPRIIATSPRPSSTIREMTRDGSELRSKKSLKRIEEANGIIRAIDSKIDECGDPAFPANGRHYTKKITNLISDINLHIRRSRRNSKAE